MEKINLKELTAIFKMMQTYQVDLVELPGGLKICKTIHTAKQTKSTAKKKVGLPVNYENVSDEIIFAQSSAPEISLEDFNNFPLGANN